MPLSARVRVEVFLPDLPSPAYHDLLDSLKEEFTHSFGGCTVMSGLAGTYLSHLGITVEDRINILFSDLPLELPTDQVVLEEYVEYVEQAVFKALDEEAVLVVAFPVLHG